MESLLQQLQQTQVILMGVGLVMLFMWESVQPFYAWFNNSFKIRGIHAFRNLVIGAINALLVSVVFVGLWMIASVWAEENGFGILHWLEESTQMPLWIHGIGAVLLLDFWMYAWHRINHEIPFFWRFHRVHHSDPEMDVTTASRFHLGEIFFSSLFRIPLIAFFGVYLWELVLYETIMFAVVQFHHANVGLPKKFDRYLRSIIVTPNMHRVHHSRWQPETDSNYSSLFSFWDRLAKTFRLNPEPKNIKIGLDEFDQDEDQTISGMMKTPLADNDPD